MQTPNHLLKSFGMSIIYHLFSWQWNKAYRILQAKGLNNVPWWIWTNGGQMLTFLMHAAYTMREIYSQRSICVCYLRTRTLFSPHKRNFVYFSDSIYTRTFKKKTHFKYKYIIMLLTLNENPGASLSCVPQTLPFS